MFHLRVAIIVEKLFFWKLEEVKLFSQPQQQPTKTLFQLSLSTFYIGLLLLLQVFDCFRFEFQCLSWQF